jgi:hypothetical protein
MKVLGYIATFIVGLIACYTLFHFGVILKSGGIPIDQKDQAQSVSVYLSFMSVMLTAVTVILAAVAIFIGIVAAYTFKELSEKAAAAAQKRVSELLSDDAIQGRIDAIAFRNTKPNSLSELELGFDPSDKSER